MRLLLSIFIVSITLTAHANSAHSTFSQRLSCVLQVPADGLPGIPQFDFAIGRNSSGDYVLKEAAFRSVGAPAQYEKMILVQSSGNTRVFKTARAPSITLVNAPNAQSALLISNSSLEYHCVSPDGICASGVYDADTDSCVFPGSIIPLPGEK